MEQVYRWVCRQIYDKTNPCWAWRFCNNFTTLQILHHQILFRTYVSDNPERSTVHFLFYVVSYRTRYSGANIIYMDGISLGMDCSNDYIMKKDKKQAICHHGSLDDTFCNTCNSDDNDMIESDKAGYYISLAIIAGFHWRKD